MIKRSDNSIALNFWGMVAYINIVFLYWLNNIPMLLEAFWIILTSMSIYKICEFEKKRYYNPCITKLSISKVLEEILFFLIFKKICGVFFSQLSFLGKPENETRVEADIQKFSFYMMIIVCLIGPILEEIVFRYLPDLFIKNNKLYIILTAIVFSYLHVVNDPWRIIFYLPNALYYARVYRKTGKIEMTIILHVINNIIASLPI